MTAAYPFFESIESRLLLSGTALADGVLRIVGDQMAANTIDVSLVSSVEGGAVDGVQVVFNGDTGNAQVLAIAGIQKVQVVGGQLGDTINVNLKSADGLVNIIGMIWGRKGADVITAGDEDDYIRGMQGDDTIHAGAGTNRVWAAQGNDTVTAGDGDDRIWGAQGNDLIDAGGGMNYVFGAQGNDSITAGDGDDWILGAQGNDEIDAGGGANRVSDNLGKNSILAGDGDDWILANRGDTVDAGLGTNYVRIKRMRRSR